MSRAAGYPNQERHGVWALDFLKLLDRASIAKDLGPGAVAVIMHIALAEHAKDYLSPPDFWNSQLRDAAGLRDDDAFAALRTRIEQAGWLVYERGAYPGAAGLYWVRIPPALQRMLSTPLPVQPGKVPGKHTGKHTGQHTVKHPGQDTGKHPGQRPGQHPGEDPGKHPGSSTPSPNPALPTPTHTQPGTGGGCGSGGEPPASSPWQRAADRRALVESILESLLVATGPKATSRWISALKENRRLVTMGDVEACLRDVIPRARAAGERVDYASHVADRIRRWRPEAT